MTRKDDHNIVHEAVEAEVTTEVANILAQKNLRVHDGKTVPRVAPNVSSQPKVEIQNTGF